MVTNANRMYDLEQMRTAEAPYMAAHGIGYTYALHRHHVSVPDDTRSGASGIIIAGDHNGTHIDALCHQAEGLTLCGGIRIDGTGQTSHGFQHLGAETIEPIVTRGVLLDVARRHNVAVLPLDSSVSAASLETAATAQGTAIREGDVVLVRTGTGTLWHTPTEYVRGAGVAADASQWLANQGVRAVGADNIAWDVNSPSIDPTTGASLPGHVILLVRHGIYIIENLYLEELAHERVYQFTFVCLPPKLQGATGAPVRPVAIPLS